MSNSVLRSRRDLLAETPLLAGAAQSSVGVRINPVSYFKGAVTRAHLLRARWRHPNS